MMTSGVEDIDRSHDSILFFVWPSGERLQYNACTLLSLYSNFHKLYSCNDYTMNFEQFIVRQIERCSQTLTIIICDMPSIIQTNK